MSGRTKLAFSTGCLRPERLERRIGGSRHDGFGRWLRQGIVAWVVLLGFLGLSFGTPVPAQSDSAPTGSDVECGLRCLYVGSVALGSDLEYDDLKAKAQDPRSDKGYSLTQLRDLAEEMGFATSLVETNYDRLVARSKRQPFACIGWRNDHHFVLLADFRDGEVLVVDPPKQHWVDALVFSRRWSGESLLFSTEPLLAEGALEQTEWARFGLWSLITCAVAGMIFSIYRWRARACAVHT